jgi:hypothetical protein
MHKPTRWNDKEIELACSSVKSKQKWNRIKFLTQFSEMQVWITNWNFDEGKSTRFEHFYTKNLSCKFRERTAGSCTKANLAVNGARK